MNIIIAEWIKDGKPYRMDTGIAVRVDDNGALSVTASDEYRQVRQKHGDPDRLLNADSDEFFGTCATTESHEFFGQEEQ